VRILVVVAIRLVRPQSAEVRKGFMRIVINHELVGFKYYSNFVEWVNRDERRPDVV